MPVFDENVIPEENLQELVDFLIQAVGGGDQRRRLALAGLDLEAPRPRPRGPRPRA